MKLKILELIASGKIKSALDLFFEYAKKIRNEEFLEIAAQLKNQYYSLEKDVILNLISDQDKSIRESQVTKSLITALKSIPEFSIDLSKYNRFQREFINPSIAYANKNYSGIFWFRQPCNEQKEAFFQTTAYDNFLSQNRIAYNNGVQIRRIFPVQKSKFIGQESWPNFHKKLIPFLEIGHPLKACFIEDLKENGLSNQEIFRDFCVIDELIVEEVLYDTFGNFLEKRLVIDEHEVNNYATTFENIWGIGFDPLTKFPVG